MRASGRSAPRPPSAASSTSTTGRRGRSSWVRPTSTRSTAASHRGPGRRLARGRAVLTGGTDHPLHHEGRAPPAGGRAVDGEPGALPAARVRPGHLVEPRPAAHPTRLARGGARRRRARRHAVGPLDDLPAGRRPTSPRPSRPSPPTGTTSRVSTPPAGSTCCSPRAGRRTSPSGCGRSSRATRDRRSRHPGRVEREEQGSTSGSHLCWCGDISTASSIASLKRPRPGARSAATCSPSVSTMARRPAARTSDSLR